MTVLAVLVLAILILNGRKENRLYRLWFAPPALRLFLEESGRESVPLKTTGKLTDIRGNKGTTVLIIQTGRRNDGILRVRLQDGEHPDLRIGGTVLVEGEVYLASQATNPGEFDYRRYYDASGCFLMMREASVVTVKEPLLPFRDAAYRFRCFLQEGIESGLPKEDAAYLNAFLLGIRDEEFSALQKEFEAVQMLRVLLQSGFHLTLFSALLERIFKRQKHRPLFRAVLLIVPCLFYTAVSGFSLSFLRAFLMLVIRHFAAVFKRKFDLLSGASLALSLLFLCSPGYLFTLSLQYYLAALYAFGVLAPLAFEYFRGIKGVMRQAVRLLFFPVSLAPVQIMNSFSSSLYAPLITALSVPLLSLTLLTGFFGAVFLGFLPGAGEGVIKTILQKTGLGFSGTAHYMLRFWRFLANLMQKLPGSKIHNGCPEKWKLLIVFGVLILTAAVFLVLLRIRRKTPEEKERIPGKRGRILFAVFLLALFAGETVFLRIPKLSDQELRIVMLDVGQGDCFLLSSGSNHVLLDCGSSSREDVAEEVVLPALRYYGIGRLRAVILTHGDSDHVSGIPALLNDSGIVTERLVIPDLIEAEEEFSSVLELLPAHCSVQRISEGDSFGPDSMRFTCLAPEKESPLRGNDGSLVLLLCSNGYRALFTGDISAETEKSLLPIGKISLLKAAHHGSDYASSDELLTDILAETVLISCGRNNPYGHPGKETMKRFSEHDLNTYVSAECGAVSILISDGKTCGIRSFLLEKDRRLWYNF